MKSIRVPMVVSLCGVLASSSLGLGCYATAETRPAVVETTSAPVVTEEDVVYTEPPPQVETYPVVVYAGAPHYYVGGRWYRRTPRGWGYYRHEPAHLARHRPVVVHEHEHEHERR